MLSIFQSYKSLWRKNIKELATFSSFPLCDGNTIRTLNHTISAIFTYKVRVFHRQWTKKIPSIKEQL